MNSQKILIVDDDHDIRKAIAIAFNRIGVETVEARNGNEAIAVAQAIDVSAVVLDIMMPKRSGILVLEYLRTKMYFEKPIFAITGNDSPRLRKNAELYDLAGYFQKPVEIGRLVNRILETIEDSKSPDLACQQAA